MAKITGNDKNNILNGTAGADQIYAQGGDDIVYGGGGNDTIGGGAGNDTLYGGIGDDNLYGGVGDDIIFGGAGSDSLYGGDGNDTLIGGAGSDIFYGADGIDTVSYENFVSESKWGTGITVDLGNNRDTGYDMGDYAGDLFYDIENVKGSQYDDDIYGNSGDNIIWGNGGHDRLHGFSEDPYSPYPREDYSYLFAGNDTFYTGSLPHEHKGASVYLGLGNNIVYGGDGNDFIEQYNIPLDKITEDMVFGKNTLYLEGGNNFVQLYQNFSGFEITGGNGNNQVYIYKNTAGGNITLGNGDNDIKLLTDRAYSEISQFDFSKTTVHTGDGNNQMDFYNHYADIDITTGKGDDSLSIHGWSHDGSQPDSSKIINANLGDGNNYIQLHGEHILQANITAGDGNDGFSYFYYSKDNSKLLIEEMNIDLGHGDNHIGLSDVYGNINIFVGNGHDDASLYNVDGFDFSTHGGDDNVNIADAKNMNIDTGEGNDYIDIRDASNIHLIAGDGNDDITVSRSSNTHIIAGNGNDKIDIYAIQDAYIEGGMGDDIIQVIAESGSSHISIKAGDGNDFIRVSNGSNHYIEGGQGSDIIQINYYRPDNTTINNYDTDKGIDILKLNGKIENYSALFEGDDLIINYPIDTYDNTRSHITILDYKLGEDYHFDSFDIGGTSYSSDAFLAEMGLTL